MSHSGSGLLIALAVFVIGVMPFQNLPRRVDGVQQGNEVINRIFDPGPKFGRIDNRDKLAADRRAKFMGQTVECAWRDFAGHDIAPLQ